MYRIAICDDEKCFRDAIKKFLVSYLSKKEIRFEIDTFSSGKDLVELGLDMVKYTIIFLDINMDEMDGIETAQIIRGYSSEIYIVFVTAYIDYSLEGYKVEAARYLLKNNTNLGVSIYECMDTILEKLNYVVLKRKFTFTECQKNISLEKIIYIESKLHKLEFNIMEDDMKIYTMYGTLDGLEKELHGFGFLRIHKSFLVNLKHIRKVTGYNAILSNCEILSIPRARYKDVKNAFISYIGEL